MAWKDNFAKGKRWMHIFLGQFGLLFEKNRRPVRKAEGIAVMKLDAIGDFVIWLDSATQIRPLYPGKKITLICNTVCETMARHTGLFDEIVPVDIRRFESDGRYKKEMLRVFERKEYEELLQTVYSRTIDMDRIAMRIPARCKIAFRADASRMNLSRYIAFGFIRNKADRIYDKLIPAHAGCVMESKRNAEFIRGLGLDFEAGFSSLPDYPEAAKVIPESPFFVLFPGGSSRKKMWPVENFAKVTDYVLEQTEYDAYVCGSKGETKLYDDMMRHIQMESHKKRIHDYCGKTTLLELTEVIRHAEFVISNDTSGIHFAAAVNTKGICLFGEFAYGRFLPYATERDEEAHHPITVCHADMDCKGCVSGKMTPECKSHLMQTGRYLCIDRISAEQVIEAVNKFLQEQ